MSLSLVDFSDKANLALRIFSRNVTDSFKAVSKVASVALVAVAVLGAVALISPHVGFAMTNFLPMGNSALLGITVGAGVVGVAGLVFAFRKKHIEEENETHMPGNYEFETRQQIEEDTDLNTEMEISDSE